MIFRRVCSKVASLYKSFFRPPSYDTGVKRRERLSIGYAISVFCLLILSSFLLSKSMDSPERSKYAELKPSPGTKIIKLEVDPYKFSVRRNREGEKKAEEELYREEVTDNSK